MHEEEGFWAKSLWKKSISFANWLVRQWSSRPVLTKELGNWPQAWWESIRADSRELMTDLFSLLESWTFKMRHKSAEHVISRLAHVCITWRQRRHGEAQATLFHELSTVHLVIYEAEQFCQRTLFRFRTADLSKTENKQYHKEELIKRFHL